MKKYQLTEEYIGYQTKPDPSNNDPRALVSGTQNVIINDEEKIATRKGYTLQSDVATGQFPIQGSYDWLTSSDQVINLRAFGDGLYAYTDELAQWVLVQDGFSSVAMQFDKWWETNESIDLILFVNGTDNIYAWSGGIATFASATSNTITKQDNNNTFAQDRFLTQSDQTVRILDSGGTWREFTYTGGENTQTLTGVTGDPTAFTFDVGAPIIQKVKTNAQKPVSGFLAHTIRVLNNQAWLGSTKSNEVYVSKDEDYTDFTFSTPRVIGDGALLILNSVTRGFARFDDAMVVFSGYDDIYKSEFQQITVGTTLSETLKIKKLKTTSNQSAQSQDLITEVGDSVAFVTFEPALRMLNVIEEIEQPQIRTYSNPIKPDFLATNFTDGQLYYNSDRIYISAPRDGKVFILEFRETTNGAIQRFWQPPQLLPIRKFAIINNELHGHSSIVNETYKLFDGLRDNGNAFRSVATFSYKNYGDRVNYKNFDEWYVEGYIRANTDINLTLNYDFQGFTGQVNKTISGKDQSILFSARSANSLGQNTIGGAALGGGSASEDALQRFRVLFETAKLDFHEIQTIYETDDLDQQWELLAEGGNITTSKNNVITIKQ